MIMKGSVIASPTLKERDVKSASRICIIIRFVKVGSKRFCMKRLSGDHKIYKEFNFEIFRMQLQPIRRRPWLRWL